MTITIKIHHPTCQYGYVEIEGSVESLKEEMGVDNQIMTYEEVLGLAYGRLEDTFPANEGSQSAPPPKQSAPPRSTGNTRQAAQGASGDAKQVEGKVVDWEKRKMGETKDGSPKLRMKIKSNTTGKNLAFHLFGHDANWANRTLCDGQAMTVYGKIEEKDYNGHKYFEMYPVKVIYPPIPEDEEPPPPSDDDYPGDPNIDDDIPF